jgi:hypothetical protein
MALAEDGGDRAAVVILATALLIVSATGAHAQSRYSAAGIADDRLVESFIAGLQKALARDDRDAVAGMVQYPLSVMAGGLRLPVRQPSDLLEYYDTIFTADLKAIVARADSRASKPDGTIAVSPGGLVLGDGAIVVQLVGDTLKLTAIRVPLAPGPEAASPEAGEPSHARHGARAAPARKPTHIRAGTKEAPARLSGTLRQGQTDVYVVWARQHQLLDVRIEGVRGRAIVVRVLDPTSGAPVDARGGEGVRVWTGRVPETGNYRVEVVRLSPEGAGVLTYTMSVALQ